MARILEEDDVDDNSSGFSTATDGASTARTRRRRDDAKLARSIAAVNAAGRGRRRGVAGSGGSRASSSTTPVGSRLRFLLSVLLVTTLLSVLLQISRRLRSARTSPELRDRLARVRAAWDAGRNTIGDNAVEGSWTERTSNSIAAVFARDQAHSPPYDSVPSGAAVAAQRQTLVDERDQAAPLDWRNYIAAMRQHFDEEIVRVKERRVADSDSSKSDGSGAAGLATVPGEEVQDREITKDSTLSDTPKPPASVPGKTEEEAEEDRKVALEDLDQETLKAMLDALYGRA